MSVPRKDDAVGDPGLAALVALLHLQGIAADPEQLRHRFGGASVGVSEMLCNCSPWRGEIDVGERVEGGLDGFEGAD